MRRDSALCRSCSAKRKWSMPGFRDRVVMAQVGTKHSAERRAANSERMKRMWASGRLGGAVFRAKLSANMRRMWRDGVLSRTLSAERRHAIREQTKQMWADGMFDRRCLARPTVLERVLAVALDQMGLDHEPQYRPGGSRYVYDEYVPSRNMLIEADGEFWHHSEWAVRHGRPDVDARKERWATENSYMFVRLRESEVEENGMEACLIQAIDEAPAMSARPRRS